MGYLDIEKIIHSKKSLQVFLSKNIGTDRKTGLSVREKKREKRDLKEEKEMREREKRENKREKKN